MGDQYYTELSTRERSQLLTEKLKKTLFSTFHNIIQLFNFPFWQASLICTIEFIQSLFFIFYSPVFFNLFYYQKSKFPWNYQAVEDIFKILTKASLIWPYLAEQSFTLYLIFFYTICGLIFITLVSMLILQFVKLKKKSFIRSSLIKIIGLFMLLFQTILYIPTITQFILLGSCNENYEHVSIIDLKCWTSNFNIHFSLGIIFLVIFVAMVFPATLLFYEDTCNSANAFAKITSDADIKNMIFKLAITLCALIFKNSDTSIYLSYVIFGTSFLICYEFRMRCRFYCYQMNRLWNAYQEIIFCASLCNLISILLDGYEFGGGLILFIVFSIFVLTYEYFFGSGSEYILTIPVSQTLVSDTFELYTKELSSLLISKSIFLSIQTKYRYGETSGIIYERLYRRAL